VFDVLVANGVAENQYDATGVVNLLGFTAETDLAEAAKIGKLYRRWRNAGQKPKDAAAKTLAGELPEQPPLL
jgi:hypothetical protein